MRIEPAVRSKVAMRMALLCFAGAAVPLAGLAVLTVRQTTAELEQRARQRLQFEARSVAQDGLAAIDELARGLYLLARENLIATGPGDLDAGVAAIFASPPPALLLVPASGPPRRLGRPLALPALTAEQARHLDDRERLIVPATAAPHAPLLIVAAHAGSQVATVAGELDPRVLFSLDRPDVLPEDAVACVADASRAIVCSDHGATAGVARALAHSDSADLTVEAAGQSYLARAWVMPIGYQYGAGEWTVVLLRPMAAVRAPMTRFVTNVWLTGLVTLLLAGWLSLWQVRRQTRPLDHLIAATGRLARRDFDHPVHLQSNDEFQALGDAFDALCAELKTQFAELEAFNFGTLTALGRAIDAKSPWTAGHSERVTAVAVALARAMDLPAVEIDQLRRGGLVHDIGKLATPPEVLDKPDRLMPRELRLIQRHPSDGVHILEPIPAFRPLLAIVGQHHEKWDGSGYPLGLAGTAIARTARVLAVADVYDALRSDRPYRPGLPQPHVIDAIVGGSGTHFDPDVVAALLAIAPVLDTIVTAPERRLPRAG